MSFVARVLSAAELNRMTEAEICAAFGLAPPEIEADTNSGREARATARRLDEAALAERGER